MHGSPSPLLAKCIAAAAHNHIPIILGDVEQSSHSHDGIVRNLLRQNPCTNLPDRLIGSVRRAFPRSSLSSPGRCIREFDSTLGYPGEGPSRQRNRSAPGRPHLDLGASYHAESIVAGRQKAQKLFRTWLVEQDYGNLDDLVRGDVEILNGALA